MTFPPVFIHWIMDQKSLLGPIFVGERENRDKDRIFCCFVFWFFFKKTNPDVFISGHQTLLRGHLRKTTWTHECNDTSACKWVVKFGGRTEGFCSSFAMGSALTWWLISPRQLLPCQDGYCAVLPSYRQEGFVLRVVSCSGLLQQCSDQPDLNASWIWVREGSCEKCRFIREDLIQSCAIFTVLSRLDWQSQSPHFCPLNSSGTVWACRYQ